MREKKLPEDLDTLQDKELLKLIDEAIDSLSVRDFMRLTKERTKRGIFKEEGKWIKDKS